MRLLNTMIAASSLLIASQGFSLIHGQGSVGTRSGETTVSSTTTEYSGSEMAVAAHLDPIPLVPVSFGLGIAMPSYDITGGGTLTGMVVDLQFSVWSPISLAGIEPYLTLGYIASGAYVQTQNVDVSGTSVEAVSTYKSGGTSTAIGIRYSIIPLVGLTLEYNMRSETLTLDNYEMAGVQTSLSVDDVSFANNAFMIGVRAGI